MISKQEIKKHLFLYLLFFIEIKPYQGADPIVPQEPTRKTTEAGTVRVAPTTPFLHNAGVPLLDKFIMTRPDY